MSSDGDEYFWNGYDCDSDQSWNGDEYEYDYGYDNEMDDFDIFDGEMPDDDYDAVSDGDRERTEAGTVVESLKSKCNEPSGDEQSCCGIVGNVEQDWWTTLPDEVMISIVSRLPFSSLASFKSVCKKWNSLILYADPKLMKSRESLTIPLCFLHFGSNDFVCYNPSSNSWHQLPDSFVSPFGLDGLSDNKRNILAGGCGLLVFQYENSEDMGLWVFNPVTKSERRLPDTGFGGTLGNVHIHVNDADLSYKILVSWKSTLGQGNERFVTFYGEKLSTCELHVYDSKTVAWYRFADTQEGSLIGSDVRSVVEHEGQLWCIFTAYAHTVYSLKIVKEAAIREASPQSAEDCQYVSEAEISRLPRSLRTAQLFVKNDVIMVAGVSYNDEEEEGVYTACIWEPNYDFTRWCEVSHVVLNPTAAPFCRIPLVTLAGDYLWITDGYYRYRAGFSSGRGGVMCRISTNQWCWLPQFPEVDDLLGFKNKSIGKDPLDSIACSPFLFKPEMCLVP